MALNEKDLREQQSELATELRRQIVEKDTVLEGYKTAHGKLEDFFSQVTSQLRK